MVLRRKFAYLGVKIREDNHEKAQIGPGISKGSHKFGMLRTLSKSSFLSRKTKDQVLRKKWRDRRRKCFKR